MCQATAAKTKAAISQSRLTGRVPILTTATLANPKITNSTYTYDDYGNPVWVNSLGDIDTTGDEKYEHYSYATNTSAWIVDRVSNYSLYADDNATLARQTIYYYDSSGYGALGSQGALTKVERWLDTELANPKTAYTYDGYGNVLTETDALGRVTTYYYGLRDGTFTFADRMVNALDQPVDFLYDLGSGNLLWEETNNVRTARYYDVHGRIEKEVFPYDTEQLPTKSYTYNMTSSAPESIIVKERTTANNTLDEYYFYDGFARVVQIRSPADGGQQLVLNRFYDSLGHIEKTSNPYFENFSEALGTPSTAANTTVYTYDALDRPTQVLNPDGTTLNTSFDHWNASSYDANGHRIKYVLDGYSRIIQVYEYNNDPVLYLDYESDIYMTNYSYDAADQLVNITDFEGNQFIFTFDSLGRRTELDDPDIGIWTYTYDLLGNLISQSGGGGNLITGDSYYREYDDLDRLVRVRSGNLSNGTILEEYTYDAEGERVKIYKPQDSETIYTPFRELMRIVNSSGTYDYLYVYDGSTLVARLNPDGTKNFYHPDHLDSTTLITDEAGAIKEETFYEPFGAVISGGVEDKKTYTGHYSDSVDQMYFGARYYKAEWGRFVQPDPKIPETFNPQQLNPYAYALNNPYVYIDRFGKDVTYSEITFTMGSGVGLQITVGRATGESGSKTTYINLGAGLTTPTLSVGYSTGIARGLDEPGDMKDPNLCFGGDVGGLFIIPVSVGAWGSIPFSIDLRSPTPNIRFSPEGRSGGVSAAGDFNAPAPFSGYLMVSRTVYINAKQEPPEPPELVFSSSSGGGTYSSRRKGIIDPSVPESERASLRTKETQRSIELTRRIWSKT